MDSRIDPLAVLGIAPGDAKILRNAGARVTEDVLRSLILATHLLGVQRICIIQHTDCQMAKATQQELAARISEAVGAKSEGWDYLTIDDQKATLTGDIQLIRDCDLLSPSVSVAGFILNLETGRLARVDTPQSF
jgi:carbonic anhydrase